MAASDVTIAPDSQGNIRLHPYLVTLVRWCVSCLWSTATVFLHRLVTTPLPQITASKQPPKLLPKPRQAGTDHLHPEPKVECVVLHSPPTPTLDVVFVHGLYGSLGNTWRQGDWRSKYKIDPKKVPLRNHTTECKCTKTDHFKNLQQIYTYETNLNEKNVNEKITFNQVNGCFKKILPNENSIITEKFYNNTFINEVNNYETQAQFVTDLFKKDCDNKNGDITNVNNIDDNEKIKYDNEIKHNDAMKCKCDEMKCNKNENEIQKCEVGCGCVCDYCYSSCWPRDWIKADFPGARVISINYTSDPYLWRLLWVKGNKRLRLHERAEQMMAQLLDLGVGQRPIIWVGHSKGGLFIKQIYCDGYEAYLKTNKQFNDKVNSNINQSDNNIDNNVETNKNNNENSDKMNIEQKELTKLINIYENISISNDIQNNNLELEDEGNNNDKYENIDKERTKSDENNEFMKDDNKNEIIENNEEENNGNEINDMKRVNEMKHGVMSSSDEEDTEVLKSRANIWGHSRGFMFYSVPHRGSPLADIVTPITARSIELLEISKDCSLVLELQSRWLRACSRHAPAVRSLVETCRTLMSVLWLRIVSVESADAGIGSLHGVAVDHREICKPTSRQCLLYTELKDLITIALNKCHCK